MRNISWIRQYAIIAIVKMSFNILFWLNCHHFKTLYDEIDKLLLSDDVAVVYDNKLIGVSVWQAAIWMSTKVPHRANW